MSAYAIETGGWESSGDACWRRTTRLPLNAKLHVPCEDGRIVAALPEDSPPWGGWLRASCIGVELDGAILQLSLRSPKKAFFEAEIGRERESLLLSLTFRHTSCAGDDPADPPPELVLREHKHMAEVWQDYRAWMDRAWPCQPAFTPDWTKEIPAVVLVEMWTGKGTITHTFDDLDRLLGAMHDAGVPTGTLLYFWGFHAPFDTRYPEYWPASELGGEAGMSRVVETAARLGYRLMPHLNYWGCDGRLPVYDQLRGEQVRDRSGVPQGWRVEGEPPIEYIRPSSSAWRELMADVCHRFVSEFPVDALFLDQLGFFADDPGCDFDSATPRYIESMQAACPGVALGGEMFHERCRSLPLWQVWGTPWCGLPVREDLEHATMWRDLFGGDFTMLPHMGMPGATPMQDSWPAYYWYVEHYGPVEATRRANRWHRSIGAVPSVRVNFRQFGLDDVAVEILTGAPPGGKEDPDTGSTIFSGEEEVCG